MSKKIKIQNNNFFFFLSFSLFFALLGLGFVVFVPMAAFGGSIFSGSELYKRNVFSREKIERKESEWEKPNVGK